MFTTMYNEWIASKHFTNDNSNTKVSTSVELTRRNIEMFLFQFNQENDQPVLFDCSLKLLPIFDKHLNQLIDKSIKNYFNNITKNQYSKEEKFKKQSHRQDSNNINPNNIQQINRINSLHCLFTWNIYTFHSKKDMIIYIKKKYGDYNLDLSQHEFTFERYILNIILSYELFLKGKKETAKIIIILIGKWLEKLDVSFDKFYLSISDGLKYVLTSMFIHMNLNNNNQSLLNTIKPFSKMKSTFKAALYAIEAAVLIEYGYNENCFEKAEECAKKACDLNPLNYYWFYLQSLVLKTKRHFLQTYKSCPTIDEKNGIEKSIKLANVQNLFIRYHEITLCKETAFYNFHKKNKLPANTHRDDFNTVLNMIKLVSVGMEPKNPLIFVNCARILMTLPTISNDLNLVKQLLIKGLQIAPNDLTVLQAVVKVIILMGRNIKSNSSAHQLSQSQLPRIKNKGTLSVDLQLSIEKHNRGENPIPYLIGILDNYDKQTRWEIMAQICSYTILFSNNLKNVMNYFMMLVEAQEIGEVKQDLILCHYSLFSNASKKLNLAELINMKIKLALNDETHQDQDNEYFYDVLDKIKFMYQLSDSYKNNSVSLNLSSKSENKKPLADQNALNTNVISVIVQDNEVSNVVNTDSIISVSLSDSSYNDNRCCFCRIM